MNIFKRYYYGEDKNLNNCFFVCEECRNLHLNNGIKPVNNKIEITRNITQLKKIIDTKHDEDNKS